MLKNILTAAVLSALLGACAATGSGDAIPAQADQLAARTNQAAAAVRQREAQENIIAYYDADGDPAERAMPGGYYRILLGRTAEGRAVVQDFYQDSRTKQISPVIIGKDSELKNFNSEVIEGLVVWYTPEGRLTNFSEIHNGKQLRAGMYNENGRLALSIVGEPDEKEGVFELKGFYDDGKLLFAMRDDKTENGLVRTYYYPNGNKLMQTTGKDSNAKTEFWKEDGSSATAADVQTPLRDNLQRVNYLMSKHLR
ncbi:MULTISPECIES: hypothetical protein [Eikenella]|uniref:Toxin-antitoxin system YwqK family antitoxin n=1 Tax=Eikenella longinqua TaxID=1795827 RepID=A0A1A9RYK3_9NEIS|nr:MULTISPECIES: hypothetical protein [Eikenella]OAM30065.1 hypothetical protein A7P95_03345 [Eikenella longinqua]